ncbi:MAG: hypothetical protein KatS3mg089_0545 [Patescibacteria group bacterium]|nr:MAG: hypothetical protein KatS3mg089_0545 [Patescibacteria group bacterium]
MDAQIQVAKISLQLFKDESLKEVLQNIRNNLLI